MVQIQWLGGKLKCRGKKKKDDETLECYEFTLLTSLELIKQKTKREITKARKQIIKKEEGRWYTPI